MDVISVLKNNKKYVIYILFGSGGLLALYKYLKRKKPTQTPQIKEISIEKGEKGGKGLTKTFWRQLRNLIDITIPNIKSKESLIMVCIAVVQICITVSSDNESRVQGELLRHLLDKNYPGFKVNLGYNVGLFGLSSILTPTLEWLKESLSLDWRKKITDRIHKEYYSDMTYYKVSFLDSRIKSPDQCITQDVENYCDNSVC